MRLEVAPGCRLFLVDIGEPRNNDLRIVVIEARAESTATETELGPAHRVRPDDRSRAFELVWYAYVAYAVRNESYTGGESEPGKALTEGPLAIWVNSALLDYVRATTFASDEFPGPLTHWTLDTEWHVIDVISVDQPEVRQLTLAEAGPYLAKAQT